MEGITLGEKSHKLKGIGRRQYIILFVNEILNNC